MNLTYYIYNLTTFFTFTLCWCTACWGRFFNAFHKDFFSATTVETKLGLPPNASLGSKYHVIHYKTHRGWTSELLTVEQLSAALWSTFKHVHIAQSFSQLWGTTLQKLMWWSHWEHHHLQSACCRMLCLDLWMLLASQNSWLRETLPASSSAQSATFPNCAKPSENLSENTMFIGL